MRRTRHETLLSYDSLVGRRADIERCWDLLDLRSFLLTGPRRVGKTELLKELVVHPRDGWQAVRADVQGAETVDKAVARVLFELKQRGFGDGALERWVQRVEKLEVASTGVTLRTRRPDEAWQCLGDVLAEAVKAQRGGRLAVFLDEVPWWLDGVCETEGAATARQALAMLRYLRQREDLADGLRMILTGSMGLAGLAHQLGASADVNDVTPAMELRPLAPDASGALFETEVTDRGRRLGDGAADAAHRWTAGFPHWTKELAGKAAARVERGAEVDAVAIDGAVAELMGPRHRDLFADEGGEHFTRRVAPERAAVMRAVLDAAASTDDAVPEEALLAAALTAGARDRRDAAQAVYALVDSWHLDAHDDGYTFVLPLFRAWWRRYGGLA